MSYELKKLLSDLLAISIVSMVARGAPWPYPLAMLCLYAIVRIISWAWRGR